MSGGGFRTVQGTRRTGFAPIQGSSTAAVVDSSAQAYFDLWSSAPDAAHTTAISNFYTSLKADGIYTKLDEFWIFGNQAEQSALLGCKLYKNCTNINAAAFVVDRGFTGAATKYLDTNFNPSTNGVNFLLNDASFGMYSRTDVAEATYSLGVYIGANATYMLLKWSDNSCYGSINNLDTEARPNAAVADSLGLFVGRRTASNAAQVFKNGSSIATSAGASGAVPSGNLFLLTVNFNGAPSSVSTRQTAFAFVGASMTATEQANLFTHVETLGDAIGWGVVA